MTTSQHLRTIATSWTDLRDALGTPNVVGAFGLGLRGYLAALEQYDAEEATAYHVQRLVTVARQDGNTAYECAHCDHVGPGHDHGVSEDRSPDQLGQRPVPISLRVYATMRTIEAALAECADAIAAVAQIEPTPFATKDWPAADRARRDARARADLADPRRWRFRGNTPPAPYTALWLLARVERRPGPFRALTEQQLRHIGNVALGAVARMEAVLDLADGKRELSGQHTCACGGIIVVYGGAGATPCANCKSCGALWTEQGIIVAA
ncbi:hypothetical protein [Streptomyces sp. V1I1]|uniref:hypothetical protein n=1 Tax=Streptomyces sp. V1I1 TaxID=3042272 RepID=UPI002780F893|nr:hypothetical protein [Streptomyces sp. V1I1]MDQ0943294.1 hypothetical protein [Streptomyces sp. V1I1]